MKSKYELKRYEELDGKIAQYENLIDVNQKELIKAIKKGLSEKEIDKLISERNSLWSKIDTCKAQKEFIRKTGCQLGEPITNHSYSELIVTQYKID